MDTLKAEYSKKFRDKYLSKEEEKIKEKYKDYDVLKLKIKLETLSNENPTEKAMNLLTNYEYNLKFARWRSHRCRRRCRGWTRPGRRT